MHVSSYKILQHKNLANLPSSIFSKYTFNCKFTDGNGSAKKQHDNVLCMTPYICITFKTTSRRKKVAFVMHGTVPFPLIQRCCSADVKIFVVSFTFATQKSTKKTPKHVANSSSCHLAHMSIFIYLIYLYLELWDIQTRCLHSVVHFYLTVNVTLIVIK